MDTLDVVNVTDQNGQMVDLTPGLTVKKHLRPGYMVPIQLNPKDGQSAYANSTEQLATSDIIMKVNRDTDGYAYGKLFLDEGKTISELGQDGTYEYFEFKLVKKSIQKLTIHSDMKKTGLQGIASFVIANAEDLKDVTKACYVSNQGREVTELAAPLYESDHQTLTLKAKDGNIDAFNMDSIHFSSPTDPYSLCDIHSTGWYVDTATFKPEDLDEPTCSFQLKSDKLANKKMNVELKVGEISSTTMTPMIRVKVALDNETRFQVPRDIVDVDMNVGVCEKEGEKKPEC